MKLANTSLISAPVSMDSNFNLVPIYLGNIVNYSIQLTFTGSPTGTLKLQCSNDEGRPNLPGKVPQSDTVVNWTDISSSSQSIAEAGNHVWNVQNCGYLWARVVYERASGTGELQIARLTVKGV